MPRYNPHYKTLRQKGDKKKPDKADLAIPVPGPGSVLGPDFKLNYKQKLFLDAYVKNGFENATNCAILAGYSEKTARSMASAIIRSENGKKYLDFKKEQLIEKYIPDITVEWKLKRLKRLIELCIPPTAIYKEHVDGRTAIAAIAELNKMQGHYAPERSLNANINADVHLQELNKVTSELLEQYKKEY